MSTVMLARSLIRSHPSSALSLNMARVGRECGLRKPGVKACCGEFWRVRSVEGYAIRLFLARLLNALLAGVERTLLALGRVLHVLASLGV